ncbi:MAG: flavodoxin [Erysipelotrichaceae bacterium]|nr:flavodoxin [Erysipelotrichaceae bacterium]
MEKILVAYFSASGITAKVAERLCRTVNGELYEIRPETPYTKADLNWMNRKSRSSVEMADPDCRPPLSDKNADVEGSKVIFVGFPIWWYREPSVIDTFLEAYDFSGKKVIPFATSGSSGLGDTAKRMRAILGDKVIVDEGRRLARNVTEQELKDWVSNL